MSAIVFGLVVLLGGLLCLAISNPLAKLATNWNLFKIRRVAKVFLVVEGGCIIGGLIGWSLGAP